MKKAIMSCAVDNVAVALANIDAEEKVSLALPSDEVVKEVAAKEGIPFRHKIATVAIGKGDKAIRYGEVIGLATEDIAEGGYVHIHNLVSPRFYNKKER